MRWTFWRREARATGPQHTRDTAADCACRACVIARGECAHDFTNWTAPVETTQAVGAIFGGGTSERTMLMQTRTCLHCNLLERRYC